MNEHKIAFIYCYNDEEWLKESSLYIQSLNIPIGYEIEIISVENAPSMCAGYNIGMKETDAKYKVYLQQDVFIINKNFIKDILEIFEQNNKYRSYRSGRGEGNTDKRRMDGSTR